MGILHMCMFMIGVLLSLDNSTSTVTWKTFKKKYSSDKTAPCGKGWTEKQPLIEKDQVHQNLWMCLLTEVLSVHVARDFTWNVLKLEREKESKNTMAMSIFLIKEKSYQTLN